MAIENENKDYARLIAAQNESARRLKISSIQRTLSDERRKTTNAAIASGICLSGVAASMFVSGIDVNAAVALEIEAINSFEALKDYFKMITPAMFLTLSASVLSLYEHGKHSKKYRKTNKEFYDMMDMEPENYQDIVERQSKGR